MNLTEEFAAARDWIANNLDIGRTTKRISVFETSIRVLGGLLSAYDLSSDDMFLRKAVQVAKVLLRAVDPLTGLPYPMYNPSTRKTYMPKWHQNSAILAEAGTLQIEFLRVALAANDSTLAEAIMPILARFDEMAQPNSVPKGLYSNFVSFKTQRFVRDHVSFGALGDSFYEYLLKLWLYTGKRYPRLVRMYNDIAQAARTSLIMKSSPSNLTYISEFKTKKLTHKQDHMACFAGGLFALGSQHIRGHDEFLQIGAELTATCFVIYERQSSHLSPESVTFKSNADFFSTKSNGFFYLLRPEAIESMFIMWRITHDERYRQMAWRLFTSIEKHCRIASGGYSGVKDVRQAHLVHDDLQQTFLLAETFKYLFLIFSDDSVVPLDKYVFNTEAHPLKILNEDTLNSPILKKLMEPYEKIE